MNLTDMMRMAEKAGLNPHLDRPRLKTALLKEFKAYTRNNRRNIIPNPVKQPELDLIIQFMRALLKCCKI